MENYRTALLDNDVSDVFPSWFAHYNIVCVALTYYVIAFFSVYLLEEKRKISFIVLFTICILLRCVSGMLEGARGEAINYLFCVFVMYVLKFYQKNGRDVSLKFKLCLLIVGIIVASSMKISREILGRENKGEMESPLYNLAVYCGAEIKNFDDYVIHPIYEHKGVFGEATFSFLIKDINKVILRKSYNPIIDLEIMFNDNKGLNLGNVYTTFLDFYVDGGLLGVFLFVSLMSVLSILLYNKVYITNPNYKKTTIKELVFCNASFCVFMSFFANRFYSYFFSYWFIKLFVYTFLISVCLNRVIYKRI